MFLSLTFSTLQKETVFDFPFYRCGDTIFLKEVSVLNCGGAILEFHHGRKDDKHVYIVEVLDEDVEKIIKVQQKSNRKESKYYYAHLVTCCSLNTCGIHGARVQPTGGC